MQSFPDLRQHLKRIEPEGTFLEPRELLMLKQFLSMITKMIAFFSEKSDHYPLLQFIGKELISLQFLEQNIEKIIDSAGEVKDKASETLSRLRRAIDDKSVNVRRHLESTLHSLISKGYTNSSELTIREGRFVIPIKETYSHCLKGIVVDQSTSGATLFVEPLEIFEMNSEINRLKVQEKKEIERLLTLLTNGVRDNRSQIIKNCEIAGELDYLMAKGKFSLQMNCTSAEINQAGVLELKEARHPILMLRSTKDQIVPLSIRLGGNLKTLIITGPNAGGKTVALKTVGLLSLMHQHGLPVPAEEGTSIPLFSNVLVDIGDRQSIEHDLSTFSSHIMNINDILKNITENSLVLLDEIGSATDPSEGASLASIILKKLTEKNCLTIATTHIGALKVFAHEEEGMGNGSMVFDQETLCPTYQFQMGIPGSSYAFEIAERLGMSPTIVHEARISMGEERGKLDRLIRRLEEESQRVHGLLENAEIKESKLSGLVKLYQEQIESVEKESEVRKKEILKEAEAVLREANVILEGTVREIRENQAKRESIRSVKAKLDNCKKKVKDISSKKKDDFVYTLGQEDWVVWKGHKGKGKIISLPDKMGRVIVQWDHVKLHVQKEELKPVDHPDINKRSKGMTKYYIEREVKQEVDLRGMRADEAVAAVERYLEDATMDGFSQVRIIHGKGTGTLRKEIHRYLKNHPLVKNQRLGDWNEGDTGVTIVELK